MGGVAGASVVAGGKAVSGVFDIGAGIAGVGSVPPIWSITDEEALSLADKTVSVIEVAMNIAAKIHVTFASAVAAERPETTPPVLPMPSPPPSDLCKSTTPIKSNAKMRWTARITFSMTHGPFR